MTIPAYELIWIQVSEGEETKMRKGFWTMFEASTYMLTLLRENQDIGAIILRRALSCP